ncbi:LuxR family transcriptional regulator [Sinisalibacter aestuarii]|uniref:Transcriptional regulator n=1 Tax=Sinisalibacter aestuarii TaxID=2949426 RepID=A0ABQ5LU92_9RHOB|nr:LuxR family transcriptional regulator [Sinisalibacter aestuarii]GKY87667.1 transcriptional regulator [Sinisalibacter aestuarii]
MRVMLDYLDTLARASTLEEVWDLHCETMAKFGFDRLIYGNTRFTTEDSLGVYDDAFFLSNHDPEYFNRFVREKMFLQAPMVRWARENVGAMSWGTLWADREGLSREEREVIAFNLTMNVKAGYSIRFADPSPRSFALIALAAERNKSQEDADAAWREFGREIETMNHMLHLKIMSLPLRTSRASLSGRQREVLEWVGEGKSHQDIATILGVTVPTVEKHLRLAREKLGVETTAQAILKAAFQNQIYSL